MDAFGIRNSLIEGYRSFTEGFVDIQDERIREAVEKMGDEGRQWPDPWLSLNPSFKSGGRIDELVSRGILHEECSAIFRRKTDLVLYGFLRDEVEYAMDTFPIVARNDEVEFGEYRTKRLILEAFDAMQTAIASGVPFESTLNPPPGHGPRHPAKEIAA